VRLSPVEKGTRVIVTVNAKPATPMVMTLHTGQDCSTLGPPSGAAQQITLNPISGGSSATLVSIPIGAFTSHHFVVDVRNATTRSQFSQACAHL